MKSGEAEKQLLAVLSNPDASFLDAARAYRALCRTKGRYDWNEITEAIVERWSRSGLLRMQSLVTTDHQTL